MAELTIRPEEIRSALNEFAESYKPAEGAAAAAQVGPGTALGSDLHPPPWTTGGRMDH